MQTSIVKMKNGSFAVKATYSSFFRTKIVYLCNWQDSLSAVLKMDGVIPASDWDCRTATWETGLDKPILNFKTGEDAERGLKLFYEQKDKEKKEAEERSRSQMEESRDYDYYYP